ncbi:sulfatase [candidate division CSSED10-310 bacterium]|uniref:Sulfatase n=1 Tax=candidate division CSSED10-310 bacterium TaxID=2855610 RepID=A0ABV6YV15_UNCC1
MSKTTKKNKSSPRKLSYYPLYVFFILMIAPLLVMTLVPKRPLHYPNIILFTVDTLRADRLGAYGHDRARTAHLDFFSKKATTFSTVITAAPETLPAHATLFTGRYPWRHHCLDNQYPLRYSEHTLSEILRSYGYRTIAISNAIMSLYRGFEQGFEMFNGKSEAQVNKERNKKTTRKPHVKIKVTSNEQRNDPSRATLTTKRAIQACESLPGTPFFLWVHYWDPHSPYNPPDIYRKWFDCPSGTGREFLFPDEMQAIHRQKIELTDIEKTKLSALYDGDVAYFDAEWGRLMRFLAARQLLSDSLLIFIGDHGESLYEHNHYIGHGLSIKNTVLTIPLLVFQKRFPAHIINHQVKIADIVPTILDFLALKPEKVSLDGESLLNFLNEFTTRKHVDTPAALSRAHLTGSTSIQNERWKIISRDDQETFTFHDLAIDPLEQNPIIDFPEERPPPRLINALKQWKRNFKVIDIKKSETQNDEQLLEMLRDLGYIDEYPAEAAN